MEKNSGWGDFSRMHWKMSYGKKGWMRPIVLRLLEKESMNGIELINKINERSHGFLRPSPGSIYPLLQSLNNEKIVKKKNDGRYELTEKYKKEFGLSNMTEHILTNIDSEISYLEDLSQNDKKEFAKHKKKLGEIKKRILGLK